MQRMRCLEMRHAAFVLGLEGKSCLLNDNLDLFLPQPGDLNVAQSRGRFQWAWVSAIRSTMLCWRETSNLVIKRLVTYHYRPWQTLSA